MRLLSNIVGKNSITILFVTFILVIFGIFYGGGVFSELKTDDGGLSVEGSQSLKAHNYIKDNFGGDAKQVIVVAKSSNKQVTSDSFKKEFEKTLNELKENNAQITSYYTTGASELLSKDKHSTYAVAEFENKTDNQIYSVVTKVQKNSKNSIVDIYFGGTIVTSKQISHQIEQDLSKAELISLPILLVLLVIIFRSITAAVLPVLLGIIAVIGATSVVRAIATVIDIDQYAINVITVLGLGLSIDYSLLMVSRFREELQKNEPAEAIKHTVRSSGRTILFSGLTVMICLLGLTLFPIGFLRSVGIGGAAALIIALIAALTILPSLLYLLGSNINKGRLGRKQIEDHTKQQASRWRKLGKIILKHPYAGITTAVVVILLAAMPLSHIKIKASGFDYHSLPRGSSSREVAKSLEQDFHNKTPTLQVVYIHDTKINSTEGIADTFALQNYLKSLSGVNKVESLTSAPQLSQEAYQTLYKFNSHPPQLAQLEKQYLSGKATYFKIYTDKGSTDAGVQKLVKTLRNYKPENGKLLVDGIAAFEYDIRASVAKTTPVALGVVAVAMIVLLSLLLRSIVIPLQALFINSFSLLAAFGILVWIFQDGHLTDFTWFVQTGSLDLTILLLIFTITLGLSMDYATFYYSRVREEFDRTCKTETAILNGLILTGPVITQAALLLFVVVAAFATSNIALLQQVGLGLALAVLIDAFIVRVILVPAVMKISGRANWYHPKFLEKFSIKHD